MSGQAADEWSGRGKKDLEVANILIAQGGHPDAASFHIHQAVEKYLKGFLIRRGWELKKIHDLESLLTEAASFDGKLLEYLDFGRKLTAFYYEDRYPPGPASSFSMEETKELSATAEKLINELKK